MLFICLVRVYISSYLLGGFLFFLSLQPTTTGAILSLYFIVHVRWEVKKTNKLGNRVPEWGKQRSSTCWVWMWATINITPYWWQKVILNFHFLIARHDDQANIRAAHFDSHWYAKQWIILCKVVTLAGNIFQHQNLGGGEYITLIVQKVRWGRLLGNNLW